MRSQPEPGAPESCQGEFARTLIGWQREHGRHDLPWQGTCDAYRIWVSEVMLQQTQVSTVMGYYARFMQRFPDVGALAAASIDEVLACWSGLGYYSRARNLHACARIVVRDHDGRFPASVQALQALPGIGRSTAGAIAAFAWGQREPILDGNVRRVLCRHFGVEGYPGERAVQERLWSMAEELLPDGEGMIQSYTQGLMDLGATLCTRSRPACGRCPLQASCVACRSGRTADLPTARARGQLEVRHADWLMLRTAGSVLLQRRPPRGLWGGLWSLPEWAPPTARPAQAPRAEELVALIGERFGLPAPIGVPQRLPDPVDHAFTHFRLRASVWIITLPSAALQPVAGHEWLALDAIDKAPLPRPVARLLANGTVSTADEVTPDAAGVRTGTRS